MSRAKPGQWGGLMGAHGPASIYLRWLGPGLHGSGQLLKGRRARSLIIGLVRIWAPCGIGTGHTVVTRDNPTTVNVTNTHCDQLLAPVGR